MVTEQSPVPEHAPPQPVKVEPVSAAAVRVTTAFRSKLAEQNEPQSMPGGELVTVPEPVPDLLTVRVRVAAMGKLRFTSGLGGYANAGSTLEITMTRVIIRKINHRNFFILDFLINKVISSLWLGFKDEPKGDEENQERNNKLEEIDLFFCRQPNRFFVWKQSMVGGMDFTYVFSDAELDCLSLWPFSFGASKKFFTSSLVYDLYL